MNAPVGRDAAFTFIVLFPLAGIASCAGLVRYSEWRAERAVTAFCNQDVVVGAPFGGAEALARERGLNVDEARGMERDDDIASLTSVTVSRGRWSCDVDLSDHTVLEKRLHETPGCM
jgi:hypothetical protein